MGGDIMQRHLGRLAAAAVLVLAAGAALAASPRLTWTGYGTTYNGSGENHCYKYKMHVVVRLLPGKVSGTFQQQGRPLRRFSFPTDADGNFSGVAPVHGGKLDVKGRATPAGGKISLDGYCTFAGALKPAK